MAILNNRIKELRKSLDMTQQEFAEKVGTARNNIAGYETGKRSPSEAVISLICKTFNVSEEWLRTGEGEMLVKRNRNDEINDFISKALQDKPESFKLRLISALSRLKEDDWEVLERFAADLASKAEDPIAPASVAIVEMTAEEAHAELDRQIRDEKEQEEKSQASQSSCSNGAKLA